MEPSTAPTSNWSREPFTARPYNFVVVVSIAVLHFTVFSFWFAGLALNLLTAWLSLFKKVDQGYRYLVVLITGNNVLIIFAYLVASTLLEFGLVTVAPAALLSVLNMIVYSGKPLSMSTFQLVFTSTKIYAMWDPFEYDVSFTQERYRKIAVTSFVSLYGVLAIFHYVFAGREFDLMMTAVKISAAVDTANVLGCLAIFYKLKTAQLSDGDEEMRHAIRCNFIQCFVPFCIGFPGELMLAIYGPGWYAIFHVLGIFSNQLVDPLSVLLTISAYRQILAALVPASKRPWVIGSVVVVGISIATLSTLTTVLTALTTVFPPP